MSFFISHHNLTDDQLRRYITAASLGVALFLVVLKTAGYLLTNSVSLLSSLVDSASDVVASLITYFGVRTALRPADDDHRYGHGKAEAIAALGTSAFVVGSASFMIIEASGRLVENVPLEYGLLGIGIMAVSMLLTALLVVGQRYVVRQTGSTAVAADSVHYMADFAVNAVVILSLFLTMVSGYVLIDALLGMGVAFWLVWKIIPVAREAVDMLMDRELPEPDRGRILELAATHPLVKGVHDLRTRQSGSDRFIELHIEFDPNLALLEVHEAGIQIEKALAAVYVGADIVLHFDPAGLEEHRLDDRISSPT